MTFDPQVQTLTQDYIVPRVTDQTLLGNALALILLSNSKPWMGEQYKFPVKLSNHTQGGSFDDYSEFNTNNENVRQMAAFDPRAYYQSVVIGGIARSVNNISKTQLLSLVKVEMESVHQDMVDDIGTIFWGDGTGNSNKDFLGILAAFDDGTGVATYGGLSRATYTNWATTLSTSIGAWDFSKARTLWNRASFGSKKPDIALANETVFGYVEADYTAIVEGNYNVLEGNRGQLVRQGRKPKITRGLVGHAGYDTLYYSGTPIAKDDKSPAGGVYPFSSDYFGFYGVTPAEANPISLKALYHDGNDYDDDLPSTQGWGWTGFVRPAKQYAFIGQILLIGNAFTHSPRLGTQGTGVTS